MVPSEDGSADQKQGHIGANFLSQLKLAHRPITTPQTYVNQKIIEIGVGSGVPRKDRRDGSGCCRQAEFCFQAYHRCDGVGGTSSQSSLDREPFFDVDADLGRGVQVFERQR